MLYSAQKNFVFIHIPKAAGTTVVKYLKESLPDLECIGKHHNGIGDINSMQIQEHCPCGLVNRDRIKIPEISLHETIFMAVLRNPLDIWISHYHWGVRKLGIYRETMVPGFWNMLFSLTGSSKRAYRNVSEFLEEGGNKQVNRNNYYRDHLGQSLFERLSYKGTFPERLYLLDYQALETSLPSMVSGILGSGSMATRIGHNNKAGYTKENLTCPEHIRNRDQAYFAGAFNKFIYNPNKS